MSTAIAWTLVFHLIGMVFWIGGLLMAAQVLAVEAESKADGARAARQQLGLRTLRTLAHPGAVIAILSGGLLLYLAGRENTELYRAGWLMGKLALVVVLIVCDVLLAGRIRDLATRPVVRRDAGMLHGVISAAFFLILILVLLKP